jgi:hypothetical protein
MRRVRQVVFRVRNPERRVADPAYGVPDADQEPATRIGILRGDPRTPTTGHGHAGDAMGSAGRDLRKWARDSGRARSPMPAKPIRDGERAERQTRGGGVWTCRQIVGRGALDGVRMLTSANAGGATMDRI